MKALCIAATASNVGKTLLTTALLHHFRGDVRPFKIGPDFIDPQFHRTLSGTAGINLDGYIMTSRQLRWLFTQYATRSIALVEGVMGYYDGIEYQSSTYDITRTLGIPTVLVMDASGSYTTLSALFEGIRRYRNDHTLKAVVFNRVASPSHYARLVDLFAKDHPDIVVAGYITRNLPDVEHTHLGLRLSQQSHVASLAKRVLEHIDTTRLERVASSYTPIPSYTYPFASIKPLPYRLGIIHDENFSFLYHDNIAFLKEMFKEVRFFRATNNEALDETIDVCYIPGGYVETDEAYARIRSASDVCESLHRHAQTKPIYAECAGMLYLSQRIDDKPMCGLLDAEFSLASRFVRLGYYYNSSGVRGHAFHYTRPTPETLRKGIDPLCKPRSDTAQPGSWQNGNVYGTYLHTMFRAWPQQFLDRISIAKK